MEPLVRTVLHAYARHAPLEKGKRRLIDLYGRRYGPRAGAVPRPTTLRHFGLRMRCRLGYHLQRQLYFLGTFEPDELNLWAERCPGAAVILDVGANVGLYALVAARANPAARVFAFEPTPAVFGWLSENVALNGLSNVACVPAAVSEAPGTLWLNPCGGGDGTNEGMNFVTRADHDAAAVPVEAVTLDDFCERQNIAEVGLLKVDVEGHELNVFRGARRLLSEGRVRTIFFESIDWAHLRNGTSPAELYDLLRGHGYTISALRDGRPTPASDLSFSGDYLAERG